ncbi:hypothetical protein [Candidatus Poriferisocius sp.]|uniref:hypothetical protein n=1 Tax=Candidatus Poriferisocius sp. TaxID=3101276 RepID=UPI003B5BCFB5
MAADAGPVPDGALPDGQVEVPEDPVAFQAWATGQGWGDGLPLIPPTPERVASFVEAAGRPADTVLAEIPPNNAWCTVEKLAVNACMAGAVPEAMALMMAALEAMAERRFDLFALNTTTSSVVPALIVNGPARHRLDLPCEAGCFGGAAGAGPAIGRALRLVMRNVGGQVAGETSKCVLGQPARVVGLVMGEWEERSPWPPLAERRGVPGDAVTVYGTIGTMDIADIAADDGRSLAWVIGQSLAYVGTNAYISHWGAEVMVVVPPPWADMLAATYPTVEDVQEAVWSHACHPVAGFPETHRTWLAERDRISPDGAAHIVEHPGDVLVACAGGLGNLHAGGLHNFGPSRAVTRPF